MAGALLLATAGLGCSASRPLRPVPAGAYAAEVSVPGVWMRSSRTFPVGGPVVGLRRGLARDVEVALRWYPFLLPVRIVGLESGATWHARPAQGWIPALHLGGALSVLSSPEHVGDGLGHALRGAVAIEGTVHWEPLPWLWPYLVHQNAVILAEGRYVTSLFAGAQLRLSDRWDLSVETGIAALNARTRDYTQPYLGIAGQGAIWMAWSVAYRFGGASGAAAGSWAEPERPAESGASP